MATNQVRQNYHTESEEGVNKQINSEFFAMYSYMSMHVHGELMIIGAIHDNY